jgi:serine/threonine-protein phosphatase 2A regulatory subunit B'
VKWGLTLIANAYILLPLSFCSLLVIACVFIYGYVLI